MVTEGSGAPTLHSTASRPPLSGQSQPHPSHSHSHGAPSPGGALPAASPTAVALQLFAKSDRLEEELRMVERELYDLETAYLQDTNQTGSVFRGYDAFLAARSNFTNTRRPRRFQTEDRIFSLSSATSIATEEGSSAYRDTDGGLGPPSGSGNYGSAPSRPKQSNQGYGAAGGGTPSSGPGKQNSQKRGRSSAAPRDGKKMRQQLEQEDSDDDDSQTSSLA